MPEYRSKHTELKLLGYTIHSITPNNEMAEGLQELALGVARGKYEHVTILPAEIAMKGENWLIADPSHITYVKRSSRYQKELDAKKAVKIISVECVHAETGERGFHIFRD